MNKKQTYSSNNLFRQAIFTALLELREQEPDKFVELFHSLPESSAIKKIGWLLPNKYSQIIFYNSLKSLGCISCDFESFRNHFNGTEKPKVKIIWQSNLNELVYLFARLREERIIPLSKNPHQLLQENFLDKYEKSLSSGSLKTLLEKGIRNDKRVELIEKIITDVLVQKST